MSKVQNLAEITPNIPFTEFNFYDLYRETFENNARLRQRKICWRIWHTLLSSHQSLADLSAEPRFKAVLAHSKSKGVRIIIFDSPVYMPSGDESQSSILMKSICDSMGVKIYDFKKAEGIYDKLEYFNDYSHMNSDGAERFTEMVVGEILGIWDMRSM